MVLGPTHTAAVEFLSCLLLFLVFSLDESRKGKSWREGRRVRRRRWKGEQIRDRQRQTGVEVRERQRR